MVEKGRHDTHVESLSMILSMLGQDSISRAICTSKAGVVYLEDEFGHKSSGFQQC